MSAQHLTDAALFARAEQAAKDVMFWRRLAADSVVNQDALGRRLAATSRRRFLRTARICEARVVDLAIVAEQRCIREAQP